MRAGRLKLVPKKPRAIQEINSDVASLETLLAGAAVNGPVKLLAQHKLGLRHLELAAALETGAGKRREADQARKQAIKVLAGAISGAGDRDASELRYALAFAYELRGDRAMAIEMYRTLQNTALDGAARLALADLTRDRSR